MDLSVSRAHDVSDRLRTADIQLETEQNVDFDSLLLPDHVLLGLRNSGFVRPSPIQMEAIPIGRCGFDMIVQAKSGTGKTCVFAVVALEAVKVDCNNTQALILAPTREIVAQIVQVIVSLSIGRPELRCHMFIGGMPIADDKIKLKRCHIAVGSPGRIKQLIKEGFLKTGAIRLFVLDEADKLLDSKFQESINWIYHKLPSSKQMLAMSATYPETLAQLLTRYMQSPTFVRLNAHNPALLGIKQFYRLTSFHPMPQKAYENKIPQLLSILSSLPFSQCFIFSNYQLRAQGLCDRLCSSGWPSVVISGRHDQAERLKAISKLKKFECRILVSTDLTARGIDAENVNLVINLDVPWDAETYLHRIGRAGRYGSHGIAITLASEREEQDLLKEIQQSSSLNIARLPDKVSNDLWSLDFASYDTLDRNKENVVVALRETTTPIEETRKQRSKATAAKKKQGKIERGHEEDDDSVVVGAAFIESLKTQHNLNLETAGLKLKQERQKGLSQKMASDNSSSVKAVFHSNGCETERSRLVIKSVITDSNAKVTTGHKVADFKDELRVAVNRLLTLDSIKPKRCLNYDECQEDLARFARKDHSIECDDFAGELKTTSDASGNEKSQLECESVIFEYLKLNRAEYFKKVERKLIEDLDGKGLDVNESLKYLFETIPCFIKDATDNTSGANTMNENENDAKENCNLKASKSESDSDHDTDAEIYSSSDKCTESVPVTSRFLREMDYSDVMSQFDQWSLWYSCLKARKYQAFYTTYTKCMTSKRF